jgi:antitoxin MazE
MKLTVLPVATLAVEYGRPARAPSFAKVAPDRPAGYASASETSSPRGLTTPPREVYSLYIRGGAMITKIQKWGNSLGLRIPKSFAEEADVEPGSEVDLSVIDGGLVIKPLRKRKYQLSALLRRVTDSNLHDEVPTGEPVGREAW